MDVKNRFKAIVSTHLIMEKNKQILMLLRKNTGYEDGKYSVIAGHVDGQESVLKATIRESREEAGIQILEQDLRFGCVIHRKATYYEVIDFFFLCNLWRGDLVNNEPHKCSELRFYSPENLPTNIVKYVSHGIKCSLSGIKFTQFGWDTQ